MDKALRQEVHEVLGEEIEWQELEEGINTIYLLQGEKDYILKIHTNKEEGFSEGYRKDQKARFRAEARIYRMVNEKTGVPSPEIIYTDFSEESVPHQFYIMEKLEGENLGALKDVIEKRRLADLIQEYGQLLSEIHESIELDEYGLLIEEDDSFGYLEQGDSWPEAFGRMMDNLADIIERRWEEPPEIDLSAIEGLEQLPSDSRQVLVHSDNRLENVLVEENDITGFLDWSFTRSGHAMYDLARAEYLLIDYELELADRAEEELEELRERLIKGYRENGSTEGYSRFREVYRYATVLWIMAGFPNWSSDWDKERRESFRDELLERLEEEKPV